MTSSKEQERLFGMSQEKPVIDPEEHRRAIDDLRLRLASMKNMPGYPVGSDEAVLGMSIPPYYTACPNPYLTEWIEGLDREEREYEDPGPFTADISVGKTHPIYQAHSYPTKVPHQAIMRLILHYTKPGDVVLDGFCGTGMTGVAAQACANPDSKTRLEIEAEMGNVQWGGRRAVLQDLSPSATFIAAGLNRPIDVDAFDRTSLRILNEFDEKYGWMYETTHADGSKAKIDYTVWSEVFTCPTCGSAVVFYDAAFDPSTGNITDAFDCPRCSTALNKRTLEQRKVNVRLITGESTERIELKPVRIHYRVGRKKFDKAPDDGDHEVFRRVTVDGPQAWVPRQNLPFMHMTHERAPMDKKGFGRVHSMWPDRALVGLSVLWEMAGEEDDPLMRLALKFWIEQAFWGMSWMVVYSAKVFSMVNQYRKGMYYVSSVPGECSVGYYLGARRKSYLAALKDLRSNPNSTIVSTGSSNKIALPNNSIDYVFVDPPFGSNFYYADLAYLPEAWHGVFSSSAAEAIVNESRDTSVRRPLPDYQRALNRCFAEYARVLKPGRWMTVEFSNSHTEVWLAIQEAMAMAGFVVADTKIFDKQLLSFRQVTATNAVKRDLVISAYKPSEEAVTEMKLADGAEESAWSFVREHLSHIPVTQGRTGAIEPVRERYPDRIYDRMVAYHVHNGITVPLTTAEFYSGLEQLFPERDGMFFLEHQVEEYERRRLTVKEFVQSEMFITSEGSAVQWLRQYLKKFERSRRRHPEYSEVQPSFFQEVQEGLPEYEQLPELLEILRDNFLQDDSGGWYVPDPAKAGDLEKLRRRSLLNEFERYASTNGKLERFRTEALKAGFDDAWDRDAYELIVSVGRRIPPEVFAADQSLLFFYDNARQLAGT
jgi:DNA modification methylase